MTQSFDVRLLVIFDTLIHFFRSTSNHISFDCNPKACENNFSLVHGLNLKLRIIEYAHSSFLGLATQNIDIVLPSGFIMSIWEDQIIRMPH